MVNRQFINRRTAFDDIFTLQRLQKAWWVVFLIYLILSMGWFSGLSIAWQPTGALKWLLPAAAVYEFPIYHIQT